MTIRGANQRTTHWGASRNLTEWGKHDPLFRALCSGHRISWATEPARMSESSTPMYNSGTVRVRVTNLVDIWWIMLVGDHTFLTIQPGQCIMQEPVSVVTDWMHMLCEALKVKAVTQKSIENNNGVPSAYQLPERSSTISVPRAAAIPWGGLGNVATCGKRTLLQLIGTNSSTRKLDNGKTQHPRKCIWRTCNGLEPSQVWHFGKWIKQ